MAGNDAQAKTEAAAIIDHLGFDRVDAGTLADSWRFEPETAAYGRIYFADPSAPDAQLGDMGPAPTPATEVKAALDTAVRVNVVERRF